MSIDAESQKRNLIGWILGYALCFSVGLGLVALIYNIVIANVMRIFGIETPFWGWCILIVPISIVFLIIGISKEKKGMALWGALCILLPFVLWVIDAYIVSLIMNLLGIENHFWGWYFLLLPFSMLYGWIEFEKKEEQKKEAIKRQEELTIKQKAFEREKEDCRYEIVSHLPHSAEILIDTCALMDCQTPEGRYFFDIADLACRVKGICIRILKEVYWELERHYKNDDDREKKIKAQNAKKLILEFQKKGLVKTPPGGFGFEEDNKASYADTAIMKHLQYCVKKGIPVCLITGDVGLMVRARALLDSAPTNTFMICSMKEFCAPAKKFWPQE